MLDRTLVAFDIETMPDPDIGRRVMSLVGDDEAVVVEMVRRRLEETEGATRYPRPPWHRIVCACATVLSPDGSVEIRTLSDSADEPDVVRAFFDLARTAPAPRLVSWNGNGFDLPILRYRAMVHGIAAPDFYRADPERGSATYTNRYHDLHVDLMDALSGFGASRFVGLEAMCDALGLTLPNLLTGEVYEHVLAGERDRVIEYCKLDTLATMLVFLTWCVHTGTLERAAFSAHLRRIREAVERQEGAVWRTIQPSLAGWPRWA